MSLVEKILYQENYSQNLEIVLFIKRNVHAYRLAILPLNWVESGRWNNLPGCGSKPPPYDREPSALNHYSMSPPSRPNDEFHS